MAELLLVDLFCGAGGATCGYQQAGFRVLGVDHRPQPRYCGDEFVQADGLEFLGGPIRDGATVTTLSGRRISMSTVDAIHASPPCQAYSVSTKALRLAGKHYPDLIAPTRDLLVKWGGIWVVENVPGAPMRPDLVLCGCMFSLPGLKRERWFELSWRPFDLRSPCHHSDPIVTVVGHGPNQHSHYRHVPGPEWTALKHAAMGINWMNREELGEAVPPPYTHHIGELLMARVAS